MSLLHAAVDVSEAFRVRLTRVSSPGTIPREGL